MTVDASLEDVLCWFENRRLALRVPWAGDERAKEEAVDQLSWLAKHFIYFLTLVDTTEADCNPSSEVQP